MNQKTTLLIIVGIAAIMLFAINCSGSSPSDTTPKPEVCECTDKEHHGIGEDCCDREDCTCTLKVYGQVSDNTSGVNFKIYRKGTLKDAIVTTAAEHFTTSFNGLTELQKSQLTGKIDEIHILAESPNTDGYTYTNQGGKHIFALFHEYAEFANYYLREIRNGGIVVVKLNVNSAIRLANGKTTTF